MVRRPCGRFRECVVGSAGPGWGPQTLPRARNSLSSGRWTPGSPSRRSAVELTHPLLDLCIQMPSAVLQRLLGVSPFLAERWAAGAVRTAYAAEVARQSREPDDGRSGQVDVGGASVLDQAADRDGSDVAGCRNGLRQGEADVDQR